APDAFHYYEFTGWSPELRTVGEAGDTSYTATFELKEKVLTYIIFVRSPNGINHAMEVTSTDTIRTVKNAIRSEFDYPATTPLYLSYNNKILSDEYTLANYLISEDDTIYLTFSEPEPTDPTEAPTSTESAPTDPTSTESAPTDPTSTESTPTDPTSTESAPTDPTSTESAPTEPTKLTEPTEKTPEPTETTESAKPTEATEKPTESTATEPTQAPTEATTATDPTQALTEATTATDPTQAPTEATTATDPTQAPTEATTATDPTQAPTEATTATDPTSTENASTDPTSSESTPTEPTSSETTPTEPSSSENNPTEPTSIETQPTEPNTSETKPAVTVKDISKCSVTGIKPKTYIGKAHTQSITVKDAFKTLKNGTDYTVSYKNNKNAGTATIVITGKGSYEGTITKAFMINKAKNPITVKTAAKTVKRSKLKKANQTVKPITISKAQGKVTYKLTSVPKVLGKLVKINTKGRITISKWTKAKKGVYTIKVKVSAKGNKNYKSKSTTKKLTIKVK
ncbi:MAG: hypothetical protein IIU39_01245, partial [Ruminococcus sp.]|nr:hypothetical protein [Ruminococcus sp.]